MAKKYYLGIDNGLTMIKAILFDQSGQEINVSSVQGTNQSIFPSWVERDMENVWEMVCIAINNLLSKSKINPAHIEAVGVTGHGDGVYLIDELGKPVRQGILSLDSRAEDILDIWRNSHIFQKALVETGQFPFSGSQAPILAWLKKNEPDNYKNIRWILTCKDWIRFKLTGNILTDYTEASTAFTNVKTQKYDKNIFSLYGLNELSECMPNVKFPMEVGGHLTETAAEKTGLVIDTPVCMGLHDVDACALGSGCISVGQTLSIMGTWSINQVTTDNPTSDPSWMCRNYYKPGYWVNLSCSPASATNLDWFVRSLCKTDYQQEVNNGGSGFNFVNSEIEEILGEPSDIVFLPFLYGSPFPEISGSCFIGVQGWHNRAHLLKAIFEGVVFNHNYHVNDLRKGAEISEIRLTGGGAKSDIWAQMFADITGLPVVIPGSSETGALGAMICASVASGQYQTIEEAVNNVVGIKDTFYPRSNWQGRYLEIYEKYLSLIKALRNNYI